MIALLLVVIVDRAVLLREIAKLCKDPLYALLEAPCERLICGCLLGGAELQLFGDGLPDFVDLARHTLVHAFHDHRLSVFVCFDVFHKDTLLSSMEIILLFLFYTKSRQK